MNGNHNQGSRRFYTLDYLRGTFVGLMIVFHFCFLLADYRFVSFDFYRDPFWLHSRTFIVSGFLTIVGISLVLANRNGFNPKSYFRRLGLLVCYAALVSISTYIQVGERWVYFGILHFIAVASVLGLVFLPFTWLNIVMGIILVTGGNLYSNPLFDLPWLHWVGLMTHKPLTNDYVPLLPWFGVVLMGIGMGRLIVTSSSAKLMRVLSWHSRRLPFPILNFFGRQAIHVYILHVPIILGLIEGYLWLSPSGNG